jgi:hypothetical protein
MSAESWKAFFDVGAVVLLFLTFAFGAGALWTGNIVNERQAAELRKFDTDITSAKTELLRQQERAAKADEKASEIEASNIQLKTALEAAKAETAKAQLELQRSVEMTRRIAGHRELSPRFAEALKGKPTGNVDILYAPEDREAYMFAIQIKGALERAEWSTTGPRPIPQEANMGRPAQNRYGTDGPLALIANRIIPLEETDSAAGAIASAVHSALDINWGWVTTTDPTLPDNRFTLIVGQK